VAGPPPGARAQVAGQPDDVIGLQYLWHSCHYS
jgi:hypothetical protein